MTSAYHHNCFLTTAWLAGQMKTFSSLAAEKTVPVVFPREATSTQIPWESPVPCPVFFTIQHIFSPWAQALLWRHRRESAWTLVSRICQPVGDTQTSK